MNNYLFFIGTLLVGLGLFVRFKLQNNFKIGSDNFKKSRSVSYILLGIGIICICFYFILDPYNTFPTLKVWSKFLLAWTFYIFVCFVVPFSVQEKINNIYQKKNKLRFILPKEYFKNIYIGLTSGPPIVISILYVIFKYFKIFPEFTYEINQLLDSAFKSNNDFIFLIYGFIFVPVVATFLYGAFAIFAILSLAYITVCTKIWENSVRDMSLGFRIIYIVFAIIIYSLIYGSIVGSD